MISIAEALRQGGKVTVEGVVTTNPTLIDPSGRLLVIQDSTGAVEVRLPVAGTSGASDLAGHPILPGAHLRVGGTLGRSYGAPRLTASTATWLGWASQPLPLRITAAPGAGLEWRLVRVTGRLDTIHRLGLRWRAELIVGSNRIPIVGLTGSQIPVGRLFAGRRVTIVGIVRRAYPSAIDRRFAIEPRGVSDIAFEPARRLQTGSPPRPADGTTGAGSSPDSTAAAGVGADKPAGSGPPSVDLRDLASRRGQQVRVSGLVSAIAGAVVSLDDGTAIGRLILTGAAAAYLDLVEAGDPLEASGLVESDASGPFVLVTDPDGIAQAGDPGSGARSTPGETPPVSPPDGTTNPPRALGAGQAGSISTPGTSSGSGPLGLLEAVGLAVAGAIAALAITLPFALRGARLRPPAEADDGPQARPTLGPS